MELAPVNILQFIFVFQAIFGALLIYKNERYRGLFIMAVLLALSMSFNLLEELNITRDFHLITPIFTLSEGPVFYLFVYRLVFPEKPFTTKQLFHFAPMIAALPLTQWPQLVIGFGSVSQIIYAGLVVHLLYQYHQASQAMRSDADALQLKWVLKVLIVYLLLGLYDLIRLNLQPYIPVSINVGGQSFGTFCGLIIFSFMIFKAVKNPVLFNGMQAYLDMQRADPIENTDSEHAQIIFNELKRQIIDKSLHHKPRLSLNNLAELTGLNVREISRAINLASGRNFNDFINQLRIDDIKQQLEDANRDNRKILDIALETGFGSKSTFNAVFKRETGKTPTEYLSGITITSV